MADRTNKIPNNYWRLTAGLFIGFLNGKRSSTVPSDLKLSSKESNGWKWNAQKFSYYFAQTVFHLYDNAEAIYHNDNKENYLKMILQSGNTTLKGDKQYSPCWTNAYAAKGKHPDFHIFATVTTNEELAPNPFGLFREEYTKHPKTCFKGMHTFLDGAIKSGQLADIFYGIRYMILHDSSFDTSHKFLINKEGKTITIAELRAAPLNMRIDMDYFLTDVFIKILDNSNEQTFQNIKWKEFCRNFYTNYYTAEPQEDSHILMIRYDRIAYANQAVMDLLNSLDTNLHVCNELFAWSELDVRDKVSSSDMKKYNMKDTRSCYNKLYFPWMVDTAGHHREGFAIEYNYDTAKEHPRIIFGAYCFEYPFYGYEPYENDMATYEESINSKFKEHGCERLGKDGSWYLPRNITPIKPIENGPLWIRKPNWRTAFVWNLLDDEEGYMELLRKILKEVIEPIGSNYFIIPGPTY